MLRTFPIRVLFSSCLLLSNFPERLRRYGLPASSIPPSMLDFFMNSFQIACGFSDISEKCPYVKYIYQLSPTVNLSYSSSASSHPLFFLSSQYLPRHCFPFSSKCLRELPLSVPAQTTYTCTIYKKVRFLISMGDLIAKIKLC